MHKETPATHDPHCAPDDCDGGRRNRYFRGKNLKVDEFQAEQSYFIERRRLLNRAVTGWGVVYGFAMLSDEREPRPGDGPVTVGHGCALDRHGREIVITDTATLDARNTFLLEADVAGWRPRSIEKLEPGRYLLAIHYAERRIGDVIVGDRCECQRHEKNFVCESAVFSLQRLRDEECPCGETHCERHCRCGARDACGHRGRGPHACLSEWLTRAEVAGSARALREWRGHWIDPDDGVALACVCVAGVTDDCHEVLLGHIDDARGPRRLIKNNELLYDLVRGCDLTHIASTSWREWHRSVDPIPWHAFVERFQPDGLTDFTVMFSRPVLRQTLRSDVFVMTILASEHSSHWRLARRVPVREIITDTPEPMAHDLTDRFRVKVYPHWLRQIEPGGESWLASRHFDVEIEVRGDLILDCHRQAVDANAVGFRATPSGNGSPGGTYLSTFRVERHHREHHETE